MLRGEEVAKKITGTNLGNAKTRMLTIDSRR